MTAFQHTMGVRITIMLDENLLEKLRSIQAKLIKKNNLGYSFSKVLNNVLRAGLKKWKEKLV